MEVVGHGQHQVARGHRPQLGVAVLDPLDRGKGLTAGSDDDDRHDTRTARIHRWDSVRRAHRARRPADLASVHHLLRRGRHGMVTAGHRTVEANDSGDFPRWGAGLAPPLSLVGSQWCAAPWDDSGMGWGGSPQGRRANGLWSGARYWRVLRRDRVVGSGTDNQEPRDRPDIDTRFEQVGRTTVAQRMHTMAVRDPRALLRRSSQSAAPCRGASVSGDHVPYTARGLADRGARRRATRSAAG